MGSLFIWPLPFDLLGMVMGVPAKEDSSQHSSRRHWGMQATPPRQGVDPNRGGILVMQYNLNDLNSSFQDAEVGICFELRGVGCGGEYLDC